MLNKLIKIICFIDYKGFIHLSDNIYLKLRFYQKMNKKLNLSNPKTFNEKLQWLKLNDRKYIYTIMVDKYEAKEYVANIIGKEYIIPTIGIYNSFDEINFDKLPNHFVIKCTHDSGGLIICKDKTKLNIKNARKKIQKSLKRNYYYSEREWPYKNVKPRIIIEEYMEDNKSSDLKDYKLFCFNGKPEFTLVCSERFSSNNMCKTYFDNNWKPLNLYEGNHKHDENIISPTNFEMMKKYAQKLSHDIPFLRVDFYEINGRIYFGELTFYPNGGFGKFSPEEWDYKLGNLINLEGVKDNEKGKNNKKH